MNRQHCATLSSFFTQYKRIKASLLSQTKTENHPQTWNSPSETRKARATSPRLDPFHEGNRASCTEHVQRGRLDGRMDGHMTTCTQRATSHKCSILFSNNTLVHMAAHFGLAWSWQMGNCVACLSHFQSNFGACRGHQGWGQVTVSSVPLINTWRYILLGYFSTGNHKHSFFVCLQIYVEINGSKEICWALRSDWHEHDLTPTLGGCQWGWLWLVVQSWKKCVLSWKKYTASLKITTSNHWEFPNEAAPAGELIVWLLTGNKSMNSRSSWGCEPIREQRMRHKGHEGEN